MRVLIDFLINHEDSGSVVYFNYWSAPRYRSHFCWRIFRSVFVLFVFKSLISYSWFVVRYFWSTLMKFKLRAVLVFNINIIQRSARTQLGSAFLHVRMCVVSFAWAWTKNIATTTTTAYKANQIYARIHFNSQIHAHLKRMRDDCIAQVNKCNE